MGKFQLTHPTRSATKGIDTAVAVIKHFNSRTPRGVRLTSWSPMTNFANFNSRTPRGVRRYFVVSYYIYKYFNSRTPRGVRLHLLLTDRLNNKFQLTHPTRSATRTNKNNCRQHHISTHAPHAECDVYARYNDFDMFHFNSRTPRGVRLPTPSDWSSIITFQLTHPTRSATSNSFSGDVTIYISTHAPHAECDTIALMTLAISVDFNSRTPRGVRP